MYPVTLQSSESCKNMSTIWQHVSHPTQMVKHYRRQKYTMTLLSGQRFLTFSRKVMPQNVGNHLPKHNPSYPRKFSVCSNTTEKLRSCKTNIGLCLVTMIITPVQEMIYVFEVYLSFIQPGLYLNFSTCFMKNV